MTATADRPRRPRTRRDRAGDQPVPEAEFTSYYGRQVVKPAPWDARIPLYMFFGGLAAGSSLLAAGAQLTGLPALRRAGRLGAAGGLAVSMALLVSDLGRPERFLNMLRTVKLTSPMSVGTWLLSIYGAPAALAALDEAAGLLPLPADARAVRLLRAAGRPAGVLAAVTAPPVAAYTAVLLSDTSTPSWRDAHGELPFVFCASAAASSGGLAMVLAPAAQAGPARRMAAAGALVELVAERVMERSMGLSAETLHTGRGGRWTRAAKALTAAGGLTALLAGRRRWAGVVGGAALVAGSLCTRMGVFEAGQASARDPRYTVVPQRERLTEGRPVRWTPPEAQGRTRSAPA
ncbi:polysulfide reductase [Georgenia sp. 311]|uniref:NrfD/PsrC family molybdoenzyme membrane anchor subunit n=1 Tax=Georgenia sp. 311 TaxID=2585134 RepID=UPI0011121A76|nr:NrfD/PsrC family molybdoenzyme membrane anchor subunit [Georgenia sp. 311]TNC19034.1 polysulfide reductase [Georgenia sp. 311]